MKKNKILFILLNGFILYSTTLLISENIPYNCKILNLHSHTSCNYAFNFIPSLSENLNSFLFSIVDSIIAILYDPFSLPLFIIFKDIIIMIFLLKKFKFTNDDIGVFVLNSFFWGNSMFATLLILRYTFISLKNYPLHQRYDLITEILSYWQFDMFLILLEAIIVDIIIILVYKSKLLDSKIKLFKDN